MLNKNFITSSEDNLTQSYIDSVKKLEHTRQVDLGYLELLNRPYTIRVAIYLRVSTLKQAESKKVSIPEQKDAIIAFIKNHPDWEIVAIYNEGGHTGKELETREQFEKMTQDGKLGMFDVVVCWSTDRMARNFEEMTVYRKTMRAYSIQITTVMEPITISDPRTLTLNFKSQDKIMAAVLDWKAEADNETRVARFNLGKMGKAKKGINPCKVPYGFFKKITYIDGDPNKRQEEDIVIKKYALVVRMIFNYYDQNGWGFRRIAEELNIKEVKAPRGKLWGYSTIKYILQNPTYTGLVRWGWRLSDSKKSKMRLKQGYEGVIIKGKHQAIINPDQFQRIQNKMSIRARLGGRAVHSPGLLSGLIYCGRCHGHAYLSTGKQHNKSNEWSAYLCSKYAQYGRSGCSSRYLISKTKAEDAVIQKIRELASNPKAQEEFVKQNKNNRKGEIKSNIKILKQELKQISTERERITSLLTSQNFDEKTVLSFKDKLSKLNLSEIKRGKEIEELNNDLNNEIATEKMTKATVLALMNFDKIWASADIYKKKMLLASLIKKVVVTDEKNIYIEFNH